MTERLALCVRCQRRPATEAGQWDHCEQCWQEEMDEAVGAAAALLPVDNDWVPPTGPRQILCVRCGAQHKATSDGHQCSRCEDRVHKGGGPQVPLLRAELHKWGQGLIHLINQERDQTQCGKSPGGCPGISFQGWSDEITCKSCLRSLEAAKRGEELRRRWQREDAERLRDKEAYHRLWWSRYNEYLATQTWQRKRQLVMRRAGGMCEAACGRRAVQVHHRTYPRECLPGSDTWLARASLLDLEATCVECHKLKHGRT